MSLTARRLADAAGRENVVVTAWMPQSAARRLAALTENDAVARLLAGDADGARESMQYADDLRTLMTLGHQADTAPRRPDTSAATNAHRRLPAPAR